VEHFKQNRVRSFTDLRVWQRAYEFVLRVYTATRDFPREETYGLTSQIRRASVGISSNIAEGSKRETTKDLCHFLIMAQGSVQEVKNDLMIARGLNYLAISPYEKLLNDLDIIGALLSNLLASLRRTAP
jgi:four helix bundle protein